MGLFCAPEKCGRGFGGVVPGDQLVIVADFVKTY
jgi:hypothetical protein